MRASSLTPALVAIVALLACSGDRPTVVVYTSVDQIYSEPVLEAFGEHTGIRVLPVFDVEATKTTGLVERLIAEADRPRADVFWNGEFSQTMLLADRGLLQAYRPPAADEIPAALHSPEDLWTAVGCRARVLFANSASFPAGNWPQSIDDLLDDAHGRAGFANPLFGTTATHAAALFVERGEAAGAEFFERLMRSGAHMADGNSAIRDLVVSGVLDWGLTDTDDACRAAAQGAQVRLILPDREHGGTLLIPGTVAMLAGAPHPAEAARLIDHLTSAATEARLVESGCVQMSVRPEGPRAACLGDAEITATGVDLSEVHAALEPSRRRLAEILRRR